MTAGKHKKSRTNPLKAVWNAIIWVLITIVVLTAIALVGVRLFGLQPFTVLSGSMEPTYKTGSIVYVKKVDYRSLAVGDPITFMLDEKTVATHRIVEIVPDEEEPDVVRYRTKGDNNDSVDGGLVHYKNVIGMPVFTIPYLGYAANYIQNPPGTYIVIAACAILGLLAFLPDLFGEDDKDKKSKTQQS
ncbi:MAG: signal peptidase I [Clostridiales bacterium]|nr:signal peptidase I [Candidatus Cacconaster stercorequi]